METLGQQAIPLKPGLMTLMEPEDSLLCS